MVDNMDPVGGVEDPNDREERLRREWADTVRRRQSAHHQQQQQQLLQPQAQDEAMRGRDAR